MDPGNMTSIPLVYIHENKVGIIVDVRDKGYIFGFIQFMSR